MTHLILASTSRHRRALLERLRCPFETVAPAVEETPAPGEDPAALSLRLAIAKAEAVAGARAGTAALVIGSDQVADLDGHPLGKPGDRERCIEQLLACSGRAVRFHTSVAVIDARDDRRATALVPFDVRFRTLDRATVERYVDLERPFDAAGGFYSEALGIVLFEALEGVDPSALVGLPLIALTRLLAELDFDVLAEAQDPA